MIVNTRRLDNATFWNGQPDAIQNPNGDEGMFPDRRASFSKGLPHDADGHVNPAAFTAMVNAIDSGNQADFNAITLGNKATGFSGGEPRRLANPQGGLGLNLVGPDSRHVALPAPPAFESDEIAAEIAENYWMSLLRDVHFSDYTADNPLVQEAAGDLNGLIGTLPASARAWFTRPQSGGFKPVTQANLFRGIAPGDDVGPYVSQFLLQDCYFGAQPIDQRMRTVLPGHDYMTQFGTWLHVQNGYNPPGDLFDPVPRYIRNGRDLAQWVHVDQLAQAYFLATMILTRSRARLDACNPYRGYTKIKNEYEFGSFGGPHIPSLMMEVATRALKCVWYQKWAVHRRLRPEVFAARVHRQKTGAMDYDLSAKIIDDSLVTESVFAKHGSYLLPMAFPEGSPTHPAYGAGHATVAGACVTVLKAWYDGAQPFNELVHPITGKRLAPVVAAPDGLSLLPYDGADKDQMTVGGELDKLAANIALGRNIAGVHWRTDYTASIRLGEEVAIGTLRDYVGTFNEPFEGFKLQRFDGSFVRITANGEQAQAGEH